MVVENLFMLDDAQLRLLIFFGVLVLMMVLEALLPRRARSLSKVKRWSTNFALVLVDGVLIRLFGPITAVSAANFALDNGWGILAYSSIALPLFVEVVLGVVLLDLAIYLQHVVSHKVPLLWRFHKVHHADRDIDATTGIRFHPVEILFSMLYKCLVILLLGPVTLAVILFEIILNASAMFNHANVRLPRLLDRILRVVIVTPDAHRVHHSEMVRETNSNYGFFLLLWDRVFKTYIAQPEKGHDGMVIGLREYQTEKPASFVWSMGVPFRKQK